MLLSDSQKDKVLDGNLLLLVEELFDDSTAVDLFPVFVVGSHETFIQRFILVNAFLYIWLDVKMVGLAGWAFRIILV